MQPTTIRTILTLFQKLHSPTGSKIKKNLRKLIGVVGILLAAGCVTPKAYYATIEISSRPHGPGFNIGIRDADAVVIHRSNSESQPASIIHVDVTRDHASEIRSALDQLARFSITGGAELGTIRMDVQVVDGSKKTAQQYRELRALPAPAQNILNIINSYLPPEERLH